MSDFVVFNRDTFDLLATLPSKCVDVTITDPPYNAKAKNARSLYDAKPSAGSLNSVLGKLGGAVKWELSPEDVIRLANELLRVTRRWSVVFCALEHLGLYEAACKTAWVRAGVWCPDDSDPFDGFFAGLWDRNNTGTPQLTGDRPAQGAEGIAIMHPPDVRKRWNGKGTRGIWRFSRSFEKDRHPNAKPMDLCDDLVAKFSEPNEIIFDPYSGGGSIGEAALRAGRHYVGNDFGARDVDKKPWSEIVKERLRPFA